MSHNFPDPGPDPPEPPVWELPLEHPQVHLEVQWGESQTHDPEFSHVGILKHDINILILKHDIRILIICLQTYIN